MNWGLHQIGTWKSCAGLSFWLAANWSGTILAQSPASPPLCRAVQLEPFFSDDGCGMGRCYASIGFRNVSSTPCTLPADPYVVAVNRRGAIMKHEHPGAENGPAVLQPGDLGEYQTETSSGDKDMFPNPPPFVDSYLFRFSPDDPGVFRVPGSQAFSEGLSKRDNPLPNLSTFPQEASGKFTFSAYVWPELEPDPHRVFDLYGNPFVELHVSVRNRGASASAGWGACQIVIEASEVQRVIEPALNSPTHPSRRSVQPCDWNGDVSHGAIAAGATVAFEVEAKLPHVCHLARYKMSVSVEHAPVKFAPVDLYSNELQPDCDDSQVITPSTKLVIPPDLKPLDALHFGLPVNGISVGLEIPARFKDSRGIGTIYLDDPVIAAVWIDNGRDTPLHLEGPHGFHFKIRSYTQSIEARQRAPESRNAPPVELTPRVGSPDTGPIDLTVPAHTKLRVAQIDLRAQYDFPAGPVGFQQSVWVYPDSLRGEDAKWNWENDQNNAYSLKTVAAFHVESR